MAVLVLGFTLLLAMASHSDAAYCICNSGTSETNLQRSIDYACGNGADCAAINQNGACYNPNTVRDHCNYAVNSYYQRRGQAPGSCDFSGTAVVSQNPPSASSGCVYQSSPSNGGSTGTPPAMGGTTPTAPGGSTGTTPPTGGGSTPTAPGGSTGTTPPTGGGTTTPAPPGGSTTNPGGTPTGGGSTSPGGMTPGAGSTNPGGMTPGTLVPTGGTAGGINTLGPSGSGLGPDYSASVSLSLGCTAFMLVSYSVPLLLAGLVCQRT